MLLSPRYQAATRLRVEGAWRGPEGPLGRVIILASGDREYLGKASRSRRLNLTSELQPLDYVVLFGVPERSFDPRPSIYVLGKKAALNMFD